MRAEDNSRIAFVYAFRQSVCGLKRRALKRLRVIGAIEGTSTLVLFGIAMPLKYMAGEPMAVRVVGLIHGLLFIGYCTVLYRAWTLLERPLPWAIRLFVASIFPFGPFIADRGLKREMDKLPSDGDCG